MSKQALPNLEDMEIRLLPDVIDEKSRQEPNGVFCALPRGDNVADGFRDVTFYEFANAINRAAWFIEKLLGKSDSFETISYMGPSDLRYSIIAIAAVKAGYKAFWSSPRNSHQGHVSLMKAVNCRIFLTPAIIPPGVSAVIEDVKMRHIVVPEQDEWLDPTPVTDYPLNKKYDDVVLDPFLVIHTSGTTGLPKPIVLPHGSISLMDVFDRVPFDEFGNKSVFRFIQEHPGRLFCPFPMFHGAGIYLILICSLYFKNVPIFAPNRPLTPELADEVHQSGIVTASFLPPSIVDGISQNPQYLETMGKMKFLIVSSAPLPPAVAELVRQKTRILNLYGQTETGMMHTLLVDPEDCLYTRVGTLSNIKYRHYEDDLYEFVMVRDKKYRKAQGAFLRDPSLTEVRTNDLFSRHPDPSKSDLWIYRGRLDDIIVFENGEKINPVTMENLIETHPAVSYAMVVGQGRVQAALLIEPTGPSPTTAEDREALVDELWPIIERANEDIPAHGRLVKELVLFTKPGLPIQRSPKGTLKRQATNNDYAEVFDAAYRDADEALTSSGGIIPLDPRATFDILNEQIRAIVSQATKLTTFTDNDDFFMLGMDSLQVLQLSRRLRSSLRNDAEISKKANPAMIYANPSLRKLSSAISSTSTPESSNKASANGHQQDVEAVLETFSSYLPKELDDSSRGKFVILTGSTGGLGRYLLSSLLSDPDVAHVFCLNRSADAQERQAQGNRLAGFPAVFDTFRVTFLQCDFSRPDLGVGFEMYLRLLKTVTHVIHNAWTVDWKLSLSSFARVNLAGVRYLIDLASLSKRRTQLFFVSSLGTVNRWGDISEDPVPEEIIDNPLAIEPMGYAQSKYVAERLLQLARAQAGVRSCVLRVGQIAGPVRSGQGVWNLAEWMPRLVRSSKFLGLVPTSLGRIDTVDWIPVDVLAEGIVQLMNKGADGDEMPVYNLVNPELTAWEKLYPAVQRCLAASKAGAPVKAVSMGDWVKALRKTAGTAITQEDYEENPALKLMDFFEGLAQSVGVKATTRFATQKAQQSSQTLRECGPIKPEWMELWMTQWGYTSPPTKNEVPNGIL